LATPAIEVLCSLAMGYTLCSTAMTKINLMAFTSHFLTADDLLKEEEVTWRSALQRGMQRLQIWNRSLGNSSLNTRIHLISFLP
jgi:hypothetical protein